MSDPLDMASWAGDIMDLEFVYDTGWTDDHWLIRFAHKHYVATTTIEADNLNRDIRKRVQTLGLPRWRESESWGAVSYYVTDDGAVVVVRRRTRSTVDTPDMDKDRRAVVLASSETFWVKLILEFRGE